MVWYKGTTNKEDTLLLQQNKTKPKEGFRCFETKWEYFIHFQIFGLPLLTFLILYLLNNSLKLNIFEVN